MSDSDITYYLKVENYTATNNIPETIPDTDSDYGSGYATLYGSFLTGGIDKSLVFNFFGFITPYSVMYKLPAYVTQTINILKDDSFLTCRKTFNWYSDSPSQTYVITGASGIFEGYKSVKRTYYSDSDFETIVISK